MDIARRGLRLLRAVKAQMAHGAAGNEAQQLRDEARLLREKLASVTGELAEAKGLAAEQQLRIRVLEASNASLRRQLDSRVVKEPEREDDPPSGAASQQEIDALRGLASATLRRLAMETKYWTAQCEAANEKVQALQGANLDFTLKVAALRRQVALLEEEKAALQGQPPPLPEYCATLAEQVQCLLSDSVAVRHQWHAKLEGLTKELKTTQKQSDRRLKLLLRERSVHAKATRRLRDRLQLLSAALDRPRVNPYRHAPPR
eukprot:EG_transcript_13605